MKGSINFGAVYSSDFSFYIIDTSGFTAPDDDFETYEIPGRSGDCRTRHGLESTGT